MKIFAYEVRKDEIAAFSAAAAKYHVDITTSTRLHRKTPGLPQAAAA